LTSTHPAHCRFDSAKLEPTDGETIPDVLLYRGPDRMQVEMFVTHRSGEEAS
jgi:hypothetical protein